MTRALFLGGPLHLQTRALPDAAEEVVVELGGAAVRALDEPTESVERAPATQLVYKLMPDRYRALWDPDMRVYAMLSEVDQRGLSRAWHAPAPELSDYYKPQVGAVPQFDRDGYVAALDAWVSEREQEERRVLHELRRDQESYPALTALDREDMVGLWPGGTVRFTWLAAKPELQARQAELRGIDVRRAR